MTRNEQLEKWLSNRQRRYADGMELFNALAKANTKSSYGNYLSQAPENPHIFDPHFTQLVNILTKIAREIKDAPSVYPAAFEEILIVQTLNDEQRTQETDIRKETIDRLQEEIDGLHNRISELESDTENHADELSALNEEFEEKMKELSAIRGELDALNTPGVKIVTEESLTPALRKAYARIKEIAPLYASLHNDIANPDIPAEERHPLAEELCKLDDERRKLWKQIDDYAEGKQATLELDAKRPEYSENAVVRGFEIARQIKRLKQNITNSKTAAERAGKEGKQAVLQNALDRIAKYETELAALTAELSAEQGEKVSG